MTTATAAPATDARPGLLARLRRSDPLTPLTCAVALAVYLPHGFDGELIRDVGLYSYGGQQVAEGVPPYVAVINRAGPLAHLVPGIGAAAARAVGADDLLGMRVLLMLISVACIGLAYVVGRELFRSRLAGLATAAALLCFEGFIKYATYGPREKTTMVLFLLAALLAMAYQRWFVMGVFIALGTLTWQPMFFAGMLAALVAVLVGVRSGRLRALARIAVGGLVPTVLTVGGYAAIGKLQVFLDDFVLINARYTQQNSLPDVPAWGWDSMVNGYGASVWVFVVGVLALLGLSIRRAVRPDGRRDPRSAALLGTGAALVGGALWSFKAFDAWPDAFVLLPLAALGVGGLAGLLAELLPARVALAATLAWALAATGMSLAYSVDSRDHTLDEQREAVDTVLGVLPPHTRILSIEAPQPLVLAHQRNLSRFQIFGNGMIDYLDDTWPGGKHGYGKWIVDTKQPTLVAIGRSGVRPWLRGANFADFYVRVGRAPGWTWYLRRDVDEATKKALRTALDHQSWRVER